MEAFSNSVFTSEARSSATLPVLADFEDAVGSHQTFQGDQFSRVTHHLKGSASSATSTTLARNT